MKTVGGGCVVVGVYVRENIKTKTDESTIKQIEDCKEEACSIFAEEELEYRIYEDHHYGMCKKLIGLDSLIKDVEDGKIDTLFTYSMSTILGSGIDMIPFLSTLKEKGIDIYYSLLCKKW